MPSSSSLRPGCISIAQVQRFIPKKWKESPADGYESMVDNVLTALNEFASKGHLSKAFEVFCGIRNHALASSSSDVLLHSFSSLLSCSINKKSFPAGKQLHAHISSFGLQKHPALVPKLVMFYASFDLLVDAHLLIETSGILHPLPWNVLISSYVRNGSNTEAILAFKHMVSNGIRPDHFTYPSVIKACGDQLNLVLGKSVHKSIVGGNVEYNLFVQNALISMYGKCGEVDVSRKIFDRMPDKDLVSWNSIIAIYASKGMSSEAFQLLEDMLQDGAELNIITWNTVAGACMRTGKFMGALELLSRMRSRGLSLDPVAVIIGLGSSSHTGLLKVGKQIHCIAVRSYYMDYENVKNALITMYSRCKDLKHAHVLFRLVESTNIMTWNSMISGYAQCDLSDEAYFIFREMLLSSIEPNYVTIASILPLCARLADLRHGREFHCYIAKREELRDHLLLWNALVDTYARSGEVLKAKKLFCQLKKKDVVTFTSLIAGYGLQGDGKEALELFEEMIGLDMKPDHVTMIAVLSACSHSGLVAQGQMLFDNMQSVYGIDCRVEHFSCMIDLFGRAGLLQKAMRILTTMPYAPTPAIWASLIGACRIHGKMDMAEWAAEKLLQLKPRKSGYYVLIANIYAAAGCWSKLANVRTFMRDMGVRKDPGCAWLDIGFGFAPFLVEDASIDQENEIYVVLGSLFEHMKDAGDVVCTDSAVEEELICGTFYME